MAKVCVTDVPERKAPEVQRKEPHPDPSPVRVGMRADEVLKMRGRSAEYAVRGPNGTQEKGRLRVEWYYADCTVVLCRKSEPGPYRVKEVHRVANAG